jgi:uncharacterized alpha-E superfamily protein
MLIARTVDDSVTLPNSIRTVLDDSHAALRLGRRLTQWFHAEVADASGTSDVEVEPIPIVIEQAAWPLIRAAIDARVRRIAELAGLVSRGSVSGMDPLLVDAALRASGAISAPMQPHPPVLWAFDLVQRDGELFAVGDWFDAPVGLGLALLVRSVTGRAFGDDMAELGVTPPGQFLARVREAVAELAPAGRNSPRTVVLAPPAGEAGYAETAYLAMRMGLHLASPADLVVLQRAVWLRTLSGNEPVDAIIRAVPEHATDPLFSADARSAAGVTALQLSWQHGGVGMANPPGFAAVERVANQHGPEREAWVDVLNSHIRSSVRLPTVTPNKGEWLIRVHAVMKGDSVHVWPGGAATRHPQQLGAPRRVRDVWICAGAGPRIAARGRAESLVDLGESVPTSAAEALFWAGVNAEQADSAARLVRVMSRHAADADEAVRAVLRSMVANLTGTEPAQRTAEAILSTWVDAPRSATAALRLLGTNLQTARAFLPGGTWGVAEDLASLLVAPSQTVPEVGDLADRALRELAALSGLLEENTVRSPARMFLLIGRRAQRALLTASSLATVFGDEHQVEPDQFAVLLEILLNANESLIAYRRRYRSDVVAAQVLRLLVEDESNPRSVAFQASRLHRLLTQLARSARHHEHMALVNRLAACATGSESVVSPQRTLHEAISAAAELIRSTSELWFAVDRSAHSSGSSVRIWSAE